jgi:glutathione S-transferase
VILVGQFDSPFVRRVAVTLNCYKIPFERKVVSTFKHFEKMLGINPLGKVPALILPDGVCLYDSRAIIEYLENTVPSKQRLTPTRESSFCEMLRIETVGIGLAEKIYERSIEYTRRSDGTQDPVWIDRLERQIQSSLEWLEQKATATWFVESRMTRCDIAVVVAATYGYEKLPSMYDNDRYTKLEAYRRRCESLPVFLASPYSASEARNSGWTPEQ